MAQSSKRGWKSRKSAEVTVVSNRPDDYELGQLLHQGQFAKLFVVRSIATKEVFVIKTVNIDKVSDRHSFLFVEELMMLRKMKHNNIIYPLTSWNDGPQMAMLLPMMPHRSCADVCLQKFPTGISEYAMGIILGHILPALEYIHEKGIIHRAIKGSHILINESGIAVLSGFKFAVSLDNAKASAIFHENSLNHMTRCLNWLSPELLGQDKTGFTKNTDVYSLGITILELCNGVVPFAEMTPAAMLVQKLKFGATKLWDKTQLPSSEGLPTTSIQGHILSDSEEDEDMTVFPDLASEKDVVYAKKCYTKDFHNFTSLCLADHQNRATLAQLEKHKYLKGIYSLGFTTLIGPLDLKETIHYQSAAGGDHRNDFESKEFSCDQEISWVFE